MTDSVIVNKRIGPITYIPFSNDLNVTSPYTVNILVGATDFDAAIAADGGAFTDETTEAGDLTTNDMTLMPAGPVVDDAYYFGASKKFGEMAIELSITAGASTWTFTWEYYDKDGNWTALTSVTDNSSALVNAAGIYHVYWTMPANWAPTSVNSQGDYFYVRMRLSTYTSNTAQPFARQAGYYIQKNDWKINTLQIQFDAASTCQVQVNLHSVNGRNYDTLLGDTTLASNTSYILSDSPSFKFRDHISMTLTEAGGQFAYGNLALEYVAPGDY